MPKVRYSTLLPGDDAETEWTGMPPLGSVYACPCGAFYEVVEPHRYANLVVLQNRWLRIGRRRYKRALRALQASR
jgi:hypothetical protein